MHLKATFALAAGPVLLLAAVLLGGEPIYDRNAGHPWDQAREIFYARRFPTGETFEHPSAFAPPWYEYFAFVHDAAFHERVTARLEAVEKLPAAQMEGQSAERRVIFLRDLWPVFDGLQRARVAARGAGEATAKAVARRDELLRRVAGIMKRLELTEEEVRALPNAVRVIADKKLYPKSFNPASPGEPFFPIDLLDKDGPWVSFAHEQAPGAGGMLHMGFDYRRSLFTLHLRTPDGRAGAERFLRDHARPVDPLVVPPGTTLALLRRAIVPTRSGKLMVSPLVESLQLIVVDAPHDRHFKFTLDRRDLLAGGPGLRPLGKDDPVDTSSFESVTLHDHMELEPRDPTDADESPVAQKYKTVREVPPSLASCVRCHNDTIGRNPRQAFFPSDLDRVADEVAGQKEAREEWKLYLRLR
jgi:hypothetical protein